MAQTTSSRRSPHPQPARRIAASPTGDSTRRAMLRAELIRQRALLLARANVSLVSGEEPGISGDLADQASTECEQDLAMQVKTRTYEKLRRIERALRLLRTDRYGLCRHCGQDIPYARLKVQPDALCCVPCLTVAERTGSGH